MGDQPADPESKLIFERGGKNAGYTLGLMRHCASQGQLVDAESQGGHRSTTSQAPESVFLPNCDAGYLQRRRRRRK